MKPLLHNSSLSKQNSVTLVEDGKVLTEPSEVVEVFNNYFVSVAVPETHRCSLQNFSDHPRLGLRQDRCWNIHSPLNQ